MKQENNFAYIDSNNLHRGVKGLGWNLDYKKFRIWLKEKYQVTQAYLFIGLIKRNLNLYTYLQECGFTLVFKDVIPDAEGKPKGNCDADLVLRAVCDTYENTFEKAVIVASDGDYHCLVKLLKDRQKLKLLASPNNSDKCSILLKRLNVPITFLNEHRGNLEKFENA
jgi:uncharacterized LabA/DUF88 family protein